MDQTVEVRVTDENFGEVNKSTDYVRKEDFFAREDFFVEPPVLQDFKIPVLVRAVAAQKVAISTIEAVVIVVAVAGKDVLTEGIVGIETGKVSSFIADILKNANCLVAGEPDGEPRDNFKLDHNHFISVVDFDAVNCKVVVVWVVHVRVLVKAVVYDWVEQTNSATLVSALLEAELLVPKVSKSVKEPRKEAVKMVQVIIKKSKSRWERMVVKLEDDFKRSLVDSVDVINDCVSVEVGYHVADLLLQRQPEEDRIVFD